MEWISLIVDLDGTSLAKTWSHQLDGLGCGTKVQLVQSQAEALLAIESGKVLTLAVVASQYAEELRTLFAAFQSELGCIGAFQAVVCDLPDAKLMAGVFEWGIDQFFAREELVRSVGVMAENAVRAMADKSSIEAKVVSLTRAMRSLDQAAIKLAEQALDELATYEVSAAYAKGKASEALGDYGRAVDWFAIAVGKNKMFRPAATSLGEALLVTGRADEAWVVFQKLEKTNAYDVERKVNIAFACIERGELAKAEEYVQAADQLAPESSKVLEAKAQLLLCTGYVKEALELLDKMSNVGPFFAAKINELGIQMSQTGKGKSALTLYHKAHRIVRPDLRYKISMNAALACRRLGAWDMALKFLDRCAEEFGGEFPKLGKIREAVLASKSEQDGKADPTTETNQAG